MTKREWITLFRNRADSILAEVNLMDKDQKGRQAKLISRLRHIVISNLKLPKRHLCAIHGTTNSYLTKYFY